MPTNHELDVTGCLLVHPIRESRSSASRGYARLSPAESDAFNQGFECAFNGGDELRDNPFEHASDLFSSFCDGHANWFEQEAEIERRDDAKRHQAVLQQLGPDSVLAELGGMTIDELGARIGAAPSAWPGRCYEIACAIVKEMKWQERAQAVYGLYKGPVSSKCTHFKKGLNRHGWITLRDGRLVDPTRWVFEVSEPRLQVFVPGSQQFQAATSEYDEGGSALAQLREMPSATTGLNQHRLSPEVREILRFVSNWSLDKIGAAHAQVLDVAQLAWLARTPFDQLGPNRAQTLYAWLDSLHLEALVPVDNRTRALRTKQWGEASYEALLA